MKTMNKAVEALRRHNKFIISTHVSPDPDALCSLLAIGFGLEKMGKKVILLVEAPIPARYKFFPGISKIKHVAQVKNLDYDAAVVVDCGDLSRVGDVQRFISQQKPIINIDHHVTNDFFGSINYVDEKASSTAEIMYELLKVLKIQFTRDLATNIYCGIMTDTGSFRYENTTARTHMIVADLLGFSIPVYGLYKKLYEMVPLPDMKAFVRLINRFETFAGGKIVCLTLSMADQNKFTEEFDLRDTVFKFLRSIQGVEAHVILTVVNSKLTRVNLRSSGKLNVAKVAQEFEGGGHRMASGCKLMLGAAQSKKKIVETIIKAL